MELVSPVEIRSYTYRTYCTATVRGEKRHNSASYMVAMHRCMSPCIHLAPPRVIVATLPSSLRPSIGRACRMPIVSPPLCWSHSRSRYQDTLVPSGSRPVLFVSSSPTMSPRSLSPRSARSCTLKTRLRYPDRRYRIPYPPSPVSLSPLRLL